MLNQHVKSVYMVLYTIPLLCLSCSAFAEPLELPQYSPNIHTGVTSCGSSACHGATRAYEGSAIMRNEFLFWEQEDAHSNTWQTLKSPQSQQIAKNLGLPQPAHEAEICLNCHTDNVPKAQRGAKFRLDDGVGCEACHGGAGGNGADTEWLKFHTSPDASHTKNIEHGLYPLSQPVARARLCLSCHYGKLDKTRKFVTHNIMGAGHPPLTFELDTFTEAQPAHHRIDDDYKTRKSNGNKDLWNSVRLWAIGQAIAVEEMLNALQDEQANGNRFFPELVFFDCHACHHPMQHSQDDSLRWKPHNSRNLGPGIVRLNDANLLMLRHIMLHVAPQNGQQLKSQTLKLHQATTQNREQMLAAINAVQSLLPSSLKAISDHTFNKQAMLEIMRSLVDEGLNNEYRDFANAEQSFMAIGSIVYALESNDLLEESEFEAFENILAKMHQNIGDDENSKFGENYSVTLYTERLRELRVLLKRFLG